SRSSTFEYHALPAARSGVWVGPDSLRASSLWGGFVNAPWASIRDARPCSFLALPYLRVYSTESRRVIWLPLFLADYRRFAELVTESAGADHPVARDVRRIEEE